MPAKDGWAVCLETGHTRAQPGFARPDPQRVTPVSCSAHPYPPLPPALAALLPKEEFLFISYYGHIHFLDIKDHLGLAV